MIQTPTGIDLPLQEMQGVFMTNLWPHISEDKKQFNHRVFRNMRKERLIPEIYVGNGNYQEVLFDDSLSVLSWFDVEDTTNAYELGESYQNVGVVFIVNLDKIYPGIDHRAVEEVHRDVQRVLLTRAADFKIQSIITGSRAYGDFDTSKLKHPDMQPWHVFRFVCNVHFQLSC